MNTTMIFSIMSENMDIMHRWKKARALHNPNDIRQYA
jgi:hypothetical protein